MPGRYTSLELRPSTGGKLVGGISEDTGAEANYTEKVNFRRDLDVEMRREGWEFFNPKFDKNPLDMPLFEDDDVTLLYQFARPNGDTALLAAAGDRLYRLFADKTAPEYVESGYVHPNSGSSDSYYEGGKFSYNWKVIREGITIPGSLDRIEVLSEGEYFSEGSIPVVRIIGDGEDAFATASSVEPSIEPPQGVYAPTIGGEYTGLTRQDYYVLTKGTKFNLYKGDAILLEEEEIKTEPVWFEGGLSIEFPVGEYPQQERYSFTAKPRRIGSITVQGGGRKYSKAPEIEVVDIVGNGTGVVAEAVIHPHTRWEGATLGGYAVLNNGVDLPLVYREEWEEAVPLYGLRETGVVSVGCIAEYGGYLLCADIKELTPEDLDTWATRTREDGIDPYGPVTKELEDKYGITVVRTQYAIMWSKAGDPLAWGQSVKGQMVGGQSKWWPNHPNMCRSFQIGQDFLVEKAGINGANLQTKISAIYEDASGSRSMFVLDHEASSEDSLTVIAGQPDTAGEDGIPDGTRVDLDSYSSKLGGDSVEIAGDSSKVIKMEKLVDRLVIYRDTGFWIATLSNSLEDPFSFTERYKGQRHAAFRHSIQNVADKFHIFVGFQGIFKVDLTTSEPKWISTFQIGPEVWKSLTMDELEKVFSFDNALTGEAWICFPSHITPNTLCFDYRTDTLSTIDQSFTAGLVIRRPQNAFTEDSDDMCILSYNGTIFTYGIEVAGRAGVYNRVFQPYKSILQSSLINFKDRFNEKDLRSYVLLLDQTNPTIGTTIDVTTQGSPLDEEVLEATHVIDDLDDETMVPLWCRALFFKDKITVDGKDNPMRIASRIFEISSVESRSQTQTTGEGGGGGSQG